MSTRVSTLHSRVNVSQYIPYFERLPIDVRTPRRQIRRRLDTYRVHIDETPWAIEKIPTRDPHVAGLAIDPPVDVMRVFFDFLELPKAASFDVSLEAQRVFLTFRERGAIETRGAVGLAVINRSNVCGARVNGVWVLPGNVVFHPGGLVTSEAVLDEFSDITGYMDVFLLHAHPDVTSFSQGHPTVY